MAKYTDESNITFNSAAAAGGSPKITNRFNDYTDLESGVEPIINAIEIDWNGADMGNLTTGEKLIINTTGQLLSYMSNISQKITNLENILINL